MGHLKPVDVATVSGEATDAPDRVIVPVSATGLLSPQLAPISALHSKHRDGYVSFAVKRDGDDFRPRFAVRAEQLETWFPEFRKQLEKDSYVGINAGYTIREKARLDHATGKYLREDWGTPNHSGDNLSYLCACYCDLDCYKLGKTFEETFVAAFLLQRSGVIPPASIIVNSGRGMWLLWLLHDAKHPENPQRAFRSDQLLYFRVQNAVIKALAQLGADPAGKDPARYIRVPGSFNTTGEEQVEWWIQGTGDSVRAYTLPELADLFGLEKPELHEKVVEAFDAGEKPKTQRWKGPRAATAYRLRDFLTLKEMRRGFSQGHRNYAALVYAWLLKCSRVSRPEAEAAVDKLGAECRPGLTHAACRDAVKSVYSGKWKSQVARRDGKPAPPIISYQTIADWLKITPDEAKLLEKLPAASIYQTQLPPVDPNPPIGRWAAKQNRHAVIREILIESHRGIPSCREMEGCLKARGLSVSHVQVSKDYKEMGISSDRTAQSRETVRRQQTKLFTDEPSQP